MVQRSFLDEVVRASSEIDVYVISGLEPVHEDEPRPDEHATRARPTSLAGYIWSTVIVTVATAIGWFIFRAPQLLADVVMVYLLGIVIVSMRFGYWPSLFAAAVSVLAFDFFFVPPNVQLPCLGPAPHRDVRR